MARTFTRRAILRALGIGTAAAIAPVKLTLPAAPTPLDDADLFDDLTEVEIDDEAFEVSFGPSAPVRAIYADAHTFTEGEQRIASRRDTPSLFLYHAESGDLIASTGHWERTEIVSYYMDIPTMRDLRLTCSLRGDDAFSAHNMFAEMIAEFQHDGIQPSRYRLICANVMVQSMWRDLVGVEISGVLMPLERGA